MNNSKHTPGPWIAEDWGNNYGIYAPKQGVIQKHVALIYDRENEEERIANAHLIAAAPEMLEALELILKMERLGCITEATAKAAVAKAKGKINE